MIGRKNIGFDRRIDVEWLDAAAAAAARGGSGPEFRDSIRRVLEGVVSGEKPNSARGKTITVLSHIWGEVPKEALQLRERALAQLKDSDTDDRFALHWAMMLGTYPFFNDVAAATGRLLTLQGSVSLVQLTHRLITGWGERSTMIRAVQRLMRSMVHWGVLEDTGTRGVYRGATTQKRIGVETSTVLVEALLLNAEHTTIQIDQLVNHPALFAFDIKLDAHQLRKAPQFQIYRQGLDTDFLELRT